MKKYGHGRKMSRRWMSKSYLAKCNDKFGYMFPGIARNKKKTIKYNPSNRTLLEQLGNEMGSQLNSSDTSIPAGYTYLGQFIDHDITLDPFSDIDKAHRPHEVEKLANFRTPSLDLDSLYGGGPSIDPHLYVNNSNDPQEDGVKLLIGRNFTPSNGAGGPRNSNGNHIVRSDFDVPRTSNNTAIIGDPRNNENLFISQLHHAFLKFHNSVVDSLKGVVSDDKLFEMSREKVIHHYQWIVVNDFLKRICIPSEVDASLNRQRFFRRRPFRMPVEFSVAAYRFGHSLVREEYDFNDNFNSNTGGNDFFKAFQFVRPPHLPVRTNWVVDLNRFFDTGNSPSLNVTKAFDVALAPDLSRLPDNPAGSFMAHLAKRNLVRSIALSVPTGQAVARRVRASVLTSAEILNNSTTSESAILNSKGKKLLKETPLWYYILKEAQVKENGQRLGKVGSIILSETFTRILRNNPDSILNNTFTPDLPRIAGKPAGDFDMADLLQFAGVLE